MAAPKKRVVKDYEALSEEIVHDLKIKYPTGYETHLISYTDAKGNRVSALPFETDDTYYLIRMTVGDAKRIVKEDDDFDDDGVLREGFSGAGDAPSAHDDDDEAVTEEDQEEFNDDDSGEDDHIIVTRRRDNDEEEGGDMGDDY